MLFPVVIGAEAPVGALRVQAGVPAGGAAATALVDVHTVSRSIFSEAVPTRQADVAEVGGGVVQQPPHSGTARAAKLHRVCGPALHLDPAAVVKTNGASAGDQRVLTGIRTRIRIRSLQFRSSVMLQVSF